MRKVAIACAIAFCDKRHFKFGLKRAHNRLCFGQLASITAVVPFISVFLPTQVFSAEDQTVTTQIEDSSVTYKDVDKLTGSMTTGFFYWQKDGQQTIEFDNVKEIEYPNLKNTSWRSVFGIVYKTGSESQTQLIQFKNFAPSIYSSSGIIFSCGTTPQDKRTPVVHQIIEGDMGDLTVTGSNYTSSLSSVAPGIQSGVFNLMQGSVQYIKGKINSITPKNTKIGTAILLRGDNTDSASYPCPTEQAFLDEIGDVGSDEHRFKNGIVLLQQGDQYIEKMGTLYASLCGIKTFKTENGSDEKLTALGLPTGQYIKSIEKIDVKDTASSQLYGIYSWTDNGNYGSGRAYTGIRGKQNSAGEFVGIEIDNPGSQPIAVFNIGGVQEVEALNSDGVFIKAKGSASYGAIAARVQGQINKDDNKSRPFVLTKTKFIGPFVISNPVVVQASYDSGLSTKPKLQKGISAVEFAGNEYGGGSIFNPGSYIQVEPSNNKDPLDGDADSHNNTRLLLSKTNLVWSYSNRIFNQGVLRSSPLLDPTRGTSYASSSFEFNTIHISDKYVKAGNEPNIKVETEGPDQPDPDKNDTEKSDPTDPTDPTDPDNPTPDKPTVELPYKYPYGNGPYMNYWSIGATDKTAPYFYFAKIETSDGKALQADRSNSSSLDFYVKPSKLYKESTNIGQTLNADNFCGGDGCGNGKEIPPGWPGARNDKRLAAAFWLLRSAANSIYAKEGVENMGSQDFILIKDDYEEGFNKGLSKGTKWHILKDDEGNDLKDDDGNLIIRRWDPNDPNAEFAKAAGWVILPEGVVNNQLKAQWYFEDIDLVQDAESDVPATVTKEGAKYRGELIDLATWFPLYPLEPGFTHPVPLIPATPIPRPQPQPPTPTMKSIESVSLNHYFTWRQEIDTLHQRLGEVRDNYELEGLWARGYAGRNRFNSNGYYFRDNYRGIQIGLDRNYFEYKDSYRCRDKDGENFPCKREKAHNWTYGTGLSYTEGDLKLSRGGNADNWMASLWLYGVRKFSNGGYLDLVGKVSRFSNKFSAWSSERLLNTKGHDHTWGYTLSAEYGNKHYILKNKSWYLDPQLQIVYGRIFGSSFRTNNNVNVHHKAVDSLIGRAGIAVGYEGKKGSVFVKVDGLREFKGRLDTTYRLDDGTSNRSRFNLKETWGEVSMGGTYTFSQKKDKFGHFYLKRSFASKLKTDYRVDIGLEYIF